jgi:hypothetical protein
MSGRFMIFALLAVALVAMSSMMAFVPPVAASHLSDPNRPCACSTSLSFSRPDLQFRDGVLTLVPRVDVSIRSRGSAAQPGWTATLNYHGSTSYASDDVTVPGGVSFSGQEQVATMPCGSRLSFKGMQLEPVTLSGITRSLVGNDQELDGRVEMAAEVVGCGFDSEHRAFTFELEEFGNLFVRGWRFVRS